MRAVMCLNNLFPSGGIRFDLTVMSVLKDLGFKVRILYRDGDPKELLEKYMPPMSVKPEDFERTVIPSCYDHTRGRFIPGFPRELEEKINGADLLVLSTDEILIFKEYKVPVLYVTHFPTLAPPKTPGPIICNSYYTRRHIYYCWGREWFMATDVVYPPLPSELYHYHREWYRRKIDVIFYERLVSYKTRGFYEYKSLLLRAKPDINIKVMGVNWDNSVKPDYESPDFKTVLEVLVNSKVYIKFYDREHFGIASAEAMASGCIPVLPKGDYGTLEILPFEARRRLTYVDIPHAVEKTLEILRDIKGYDALKKKIGKHVKEVLDMERAKEKIKCILETLPFYA